LNSDFINLHTGANGEIYVRSQRKCPYCNFSKAEAVRLPHWVDVAIDREKIDWSKNTGRFW
jgi:hypothetical protein